MSGPTQALVTEAARRALNGDKRAAKILQRWIIEYPDLTIQAVQAAISEALGYRA